jgi:hypothetical protein
MKNKLRHLTSAILVLGFAAAVYLLAEPMVSRWRTQKAEAKSSEASNKRTNNFRRVLPANIQVDPLGDRHMLLAIARLEQIQQVTARLQHQAHVEKLRMEGRGEYLQRGRGNNRHVRWLLESQHDGVRASLLQITNGRVLWTDRNIASGRHIERVDLWQLRRMLNRTNSDDLMGGLVSSTPLSPQPATSFGGLPMLLESLRLHFEFTAPGTFRAPEHLGLGNQPVIAMIGRWRPESLAGVLATLDDVTREEITAELLLQRLEERLSSGSLPSRLPSNVLILLGQSDLFPYIIEYRSANDPLASDQAPAAALFQLSRQPLARLEFFDVTFDREPSDIEFHYDPPVEPPSYDVTNQYVDRMQRREAVQLAQQQAAKRMANGSPSDARH